LKKLEQVWLENVCFETVGLKHLALPSKTTRYDNKCGHFGKLAGRVDKVALQGDLWFPFSEAVYFLRD